MKGIKNSQYQNGVKHIFKLEVLSGNSQGSYIIKEPDGFAETNIVIDINETYFNIDNFILGETSKIKFVEHQDPEAFALIQSVYYELGGDGQIVFRWIVSNNGEEKDMLENGFEINLNKFKLGYEKSGRYIETEIKKREVQNKFFTREDTTINLFATKNIDGNPISPVATQDIIFKQGNSQLKNSWYMAYGYIVGGNMLRNEKPSRYRLNGANHKEAENMIFLRDKNLKIFPSFNKSENTEFGDVPGLFGRAVRKRKIIQNLDLPIFEYFNYVTLESRMMTVNASLSSVKVEISNLEVRAAATDPATGEKRPIKFSLCIMGRFGEKILKNSVEMKDNPKYHEIVIKNETFNIGDLLAGDGLSLYFLIDSNGIEFSPINLTTYYTEFLLMKTTASIEVYAEIENLAQNAKGITLFDALNKIAENYSDGELSLQSRILSKYGLWDNQMIATGLFLRGVAENLFGVEKLNTSFKSLFFDGVNPLLALGYDVQNNKLIVEEISYFFKDYLSYDLTEKPFVQEEFSIENDSDISYNTLIFGTKKYSTKKKGDLLNFNTKMECSTPIKSIKRKFDKTTEFITDEYKISEMLTDKTNQTSDNDDDLIILDTIHRETYTDVGTFKSLSHQNRNGHLALVSSEVGWDTLPIKQGDLITIQEGLNKGTWSIKDTPRLNVLTLNKTENIEVGTAMTRISYQLKGVTKNRVATPDEGFVTAENIRNTNATANLIHNPKYQMFRWYPYFGGGLNRKLPSENIAVTSYKNNGNVKVEIDNSLARKGISFVETLNGTTSLHNLIQGNRVLFSGVKIEITLCDVSFEEFFNLYSRWRYGVDAHTGQRIPSRGYINVTINGKIYSIYPFGSNAIEYQRKYRELTIKGKLKR